MLSHCQIHVMESEKKMFICSVNLMLVEQSVNNFVSIDSNETKFFDNDTPYE